MLLVHNSMDIMRRLICLVRSHAKHTPSFRNAMLYVLSLPMTSSMQKWVNEMQKVSPSLPTYNCGLFTKMSPSSAADGPVSSNASSADNPIQPAT